MWTQQIILFSREWRVVCNRKNKKPKLKRTNLFVLDFSTEGKILKKRLRNQRENMKGLMLLFIVFYSLRISFSNLYFYNFYFSLLFLHHVSLFIPLFSIFISIPASYSIIHSPIFIFQIYSCILFHYSVPYFHFSFPFLYHFHSCILFHCSFPYFYFSPRTSSAESVGRAGLQYWASDVYTKKKEV